MDEDDDYGGMTPLVTLGGAPKGKAGKAGKAVDVEKQTAIDITSDDLVARLTPPNVADLVLLSMVSGQGRGGPGRSAVSRQWSVVSQCPGGGQWSVVSGQRP